MNVVLVDTKIQIIPQARSTYINVVYELYPCTMHVVVFILLLHPRLRTMLQ